MALKIRKKKKELISEIVDLDGWVKKAIAYRNKNKVIRYHMAEVDRDPC